MVYPDDAVLITRNISTRGWKHAPAYMTVIVKRRTFIKIMAGYEAWQCNITPITLDYGAQCDRLIRLMIIKDSPICHAWPLCAVTIIAHLVSVVNCKLFL
jgi:hypothetical protein